jgi:hypothetical protein
MDENMIKARLVFEAQGKPQKGVEDSLMRLVDGIKKVPGVEVFDVVKEPAIVVKGTDLFSGLVDVGIQTKHFEKLFTVVLSFGPSAIIVLEPDKVAVGISELQLALNDLAQVLHGMATEALTSKIQLIKHLNEKKTKKK